jgi:ATP-dependent DNA helicase RecG
MALAIRVMKNSVPERRTDGKPPPRVGAVVLLPNGRVETACRGELREGDHAEFTLAAHALNERKAQRVLKRVVAGGLIRPVGKGPATQYIVNPP